MQFSNSKAIISVQLILMQPILDNTVENVNGRLRSIKSRCKKEKTKDIVDFDSIEVLKSWIQ